MTVNRVPLALRNQLGEEGTEELLLLLGDQRKEWTTDVTHLVTDRFERRLVEETSKLRVDMAQGFAVTRQEIAAVDGSLRREMAEGFAGLRQQIADQKFDILKWVFVFWAGQFVAVAGVLAVLIRVLRPA